jgi:hypothetical protein
MTEELKCCDNKSSKAKTKEPDTFIGSDLCKLNNFVLLCNLYLYNNPSYSDNEAKFNFALFYLHEMALKYFEPTLSEVDGISDWLVNWAAFVRNLQLQFGPLGLTTDTEDCLDNLKMKDGQHILKYNLAISPNRLE